MSSILLPISPAGTTNVASGLWLASGIVPNVSGQAVSISGNVVNVSGSFITTSIASGAVSVASGAISVVSGSITINSGTIFLPATTQSGHSYVLEVGSNTFIPTASGAGQGTFSSGGITLASCGPLVSLTMRSLSGNGPILVGGTTALNNPNISGVSFFNGIELFANESLTLKVSNSNLINILNETAGTSGQRVSMVGLGQT